MQAGALPLDELPLARGLCPSTLQKASCPSTLKGSAPRLGEGLCPSTPKGLCPLDPARGSAP